MSTTNGYYPSPIKTRLSDSEPVPKGWKWVELQDVARLESGHTPSRKVAEYWDGGDIPWLSLKDIRGMKSRYVMDTIDKPTMLGIDNSSARVLPKGTVAFCRTASVGNVAILGRDMATSQDFVDWVCGPELLPEFLYEAFKASGPTFANEMQGSTHKTIYMPTVERFKILLPPLSEQKRIADILDKADSIRRKRVETGQQSASLTKSVFLQLFGDPATNPHNWKTGPVGELFNEERGGTRCGPFGTALRKSEYVDTGVPVWGIDNVSPDRFVPKGSLFITEEKYYSLQSYSVEDGDLLISRAGSVGRVCVARPNVEHSIIGTNLIRVSLSPEKLRPEYLSSLLTYFAKRIGSLRVSSDDDAYSFMKTSVLERLEIPVPAMARQLEYVDFLLAHSRHLELQQRATNEVNNLFNSLVQRAFKGEL